MERHERYDPEDIEGLMRERSFDELLEAERAYVLRHLSGRAEYESMRALLNIMERGDGRTPAIDPEESVRINVMAAFREARTPRWQIWLNAVGAALWPENVRAAWRPALALGTVALLIVGGITAVRMFHQDTTPELAEVRRTEQPAEPPPPPSAAAEKEEESTMVPVEEPPLPAPSQVSDHHADAATTARATMSMDDETERLVHAEVAAKAEGDAYLAETAVTMPQAAPAAAEHVALDEVMIARERAASSRTVQAKELAQNQSMADVDMVVGMNSRTEGKKAADRKAATQGRRLADDAALMDLMAAGW